MLNCLSVWFSYTVHKILAPIPANRALTLEAFPLVKVQHEILPFRHNVNPTFVELVYQSHSEGFSLTSHFSDSFRAPPHDFVWHRVSEISGHRFYFGICIRLFYFLCHSELEKRPPLSEKQMFCEGQTQDGGPVCPVWVWDSGIVACSDSDLEVELLISQLSYSQCMHTLWLLANCSNVGELWRVSHQKKAVCLEEDNENCIFRQLSVIDFSWP